MNPSGASTIVFANAGFGVAGNVQMLTLADYRRQFDTNVYGVLRTLYESLDALRDRRGRFVVMGSAAPELRRLAGAAVTVRRFLPAGWRP